MSKRRRTLIFSYVYTQLFCNIIFFRKFSQKIKILKIVQILNMSKDRSIYIGLKFIDDIRYYGLWSFFFNKDHERNKLKSWIWRLPGSKTKWCNRGKINLNKNVLLFGIQMNLAEDKMFPRHLLVPPFHHYQQKVWIPELVGAVTKRVTWGSSFA